MLAEYDAIIQEQVDQGVAEKVPNEAVGKEFYQTKIVYDASARERDNTLSLNDCFTNWSTLTEPTSECSCSKSTSPGGSCRGCTKGISPSFS